MKQKIVYIAGLGHSGSTILDLALGSHPEVTGLGEVYTILNKTRRERHMGSLCSCGKIGTGCDFWKEADRVLDGSEVTEEQYQLLIEQFQKHFGSEKILVDSSKNSYAYLNWLNRSNNLKVIFLTRDIRSWIYSRHLSTGKPLLTLAIRWYLENMKLLHMFRKMNIRIKPVGYEEIAQYPEHLMPIISEYIGIRYDKVMLQPSKSNSHIISGNIARTDPVKQSRFIYDARWFLSSRMFLLSPMLLCFRRLNRKYVYSNISGNHLKEFYLFGNKRRDEFSKKYN